jgi:hypothetical protein
VNHPFNAVLKNFNENRMEMNLFYLAKKEFALLGQALSLQQHLIQNLQDAALHIALPTSGSGELFAAHKAPHNSGALAEYYLLILALLASHFYEL